MMKSKGQTYQAPSRVDAGVARPDAVEPLGLGKLPETVLLHDVGSQELEPPGYCRGKENYCVEY